VKPPPFQYCAPETIDAALAALARHGEDGKVLAGGQSLVPLLNFRLARPETLIDINRVQALSYVRRRDGVLHIGALTRHAALEHSALVADGWPVLAEALHELAHPQIRNRGTIGGSVAHADPCAELPVVFTALDASFVARSAHGARVLSAEQMFVANLTSALRTDELLVEIRVPPIRPGSGWAFMEFARRHGDFAMGGAAIIAPREDGANRFGADTRIVLLGAGPTPMCARDAERLVGERRFDSALAHQAGQAAAAAATPPSDMHGDADYRRELLAVLTERALLTAWERSR
jgi:CO/xanthine dehydrogenase FAD-binding subunit